MQLLTKQFVGPLTWFVFVGAAVAHLLAVFVRDSAFALPALAVAVVVVLILTVRSLPHGLFAAFAEIFVGGHGHLIDAEVLGFSLSLRMAIFAGVMIGFGVLWIKRDVSVDWLPAQILPWALLAIAVAFGTLIGFLENDPLHAFDDANGYLMIAYILPLLAIEWNALTKRQLLQVLFGSALWLVVFTLGLSAAFNHLDGKTLSHVYTFVRDARLAEVTLQTADISTSEELFYWYRIFMQSHVFIVTALLLFYSAIAMLWRDQRVPLFASVSFALLASVLVISMSRSLILGLFIASGVIFVSSWFHGAKPFKHAWMRTSLVIVLVAAAGGIAGLSALLPPKPDITQAAFYQTSGDIDRDLAISSRWQLLPEMMAEIYASPIIGSGFGEEVTFISDDPRVRAIHADGAWTTYRFEWGFQDIWLKMGVLGLLAFGAYAAVMASVSWYTAKKHGNAWLTIGLASGVVMVYAAHVFTPFLNHPIGLAAMMLPMPFMDWRGWSAWVAERKRMRTARVRAMEMSPAMRADE